MSEIPEEVRIFLVEAYENLDQVEIDLVELEKDPSNTEILNRVFRSIHTIKGNCGFLAFQRLEEICHTGEALLDKLRAGTVVLTPAITTHLLELTDLLRRMLNGIEQSGQEGNEDFSKLKAELIAQSGG